jgi:hypothetical protein
MNYIKLSKLPCRQSFSDFDSHYGGSVPDR